MSVEDNQITVTVRRALVSSWVDITLVNVRSTRGNVYISGHLKRMTHQHADMYVKLLQTMDMSLRRLKGVRDVRYILDNWSRDIAGFWTPLKSKEAPAMADSSAQEGGAPKTPQTVEVEDTGETLADFTGDAAPPSKPAGPAATSST